MGDTHTTAQHSMATATDPSQPILLTVSTPDAESILSGIVHVHAHCILHDRTLATYLPPLSYPRMIAYWRSRLDEVSKQSRHIIVSLQPVSSRTSNDSSPPLFAADVDPSPATPTVLISDAEYEVASVVSLNKPESETGPFRADLEKLFTSPFHRRKGVARIVIRELERVAREDGRWSLLLGTIVGTEAEKVYARLGYRRMGEVEEYGIEPITGKLVDASWYSKDLRKSALI